jgi:hypothetical protein
MMDYVLVEGYGWIYERERKRLSKKMAKSLHTLNM